MFSLSVLMICSFHLKGFLAWCLFSEKDKKLSDLFGFDISSWIFSACDEVAVMSVFPYTCPLHPLGFLVLCSLLG